jgi:histidinol-phosphate aminotransferase
MSISRRSLLRRLGAAAAGTAVVPSLADASLSAAPGEPRLTSEASRPGRAIRLSRNENAYGPSAKVIATMREAALTVANRHPEVELDALRNKIAAVHRVTAEQVVPGCGSSEILRMAVDAFVGPRKKLIAAMPTFELIGDCARRTGAEIVAVPLTRNYSHDLDAMLAPSDAATGLVYICNPNNPTGSLTRRQDVEAFLRKLPATACLLIDEAYHHYAGNSSDYASFIDRPVDDGRVIVARSFSKIYGLAGLRVGYAVAAVKMARRLASYALPENVNVVAAKAACTALDDTEHVRLSVKRNDDDRQELFNQANARMLRAIDSRTNFVMVNTGRPAVEVVEHFRKNNVLISGPFAPFDTYIRVSLGTPAEMREFWRVWDLMPAHKMSM